MARKALSVLEDDEADDPIISVVNIIDLFLVIIATLLIAVMENPLNKFMSEDVMVIKDPGKETMEMLVKKGNELKHYKSSSEIGEGQGARVGATYRLNDGTMIYVPEDN